MRNNGRGETLNEQWSGRRSSRGSVWGDCEPAEHPRLVSG